MAPKSKQPSSSLNSLTKDEQNNTVPQWHALEVQDVLTELGLNNNNNTNDIINNGLSSEEAAIRLEKYGYNKLSEKEKTPLYKRIWKLVANFLVGILVVVAIICLVKGFTAKTSQDRLTNFIEVGLITFVVVLNTTIGIVQEGSAEKAAEALKNMLSSEAIVIRDGKQTKVPATEIVPGDIVQLGLGDRIPADLRMVEVNNIATLEAALTGESVPIEKSVDALITDLDPRQIPLGDRKNMCFSATLVSQGTGKGVIVATGNATEIGTINKLVTQVDDKRTPVLEQIEFVSKCIAAFVIFTAAVTWIVAFFMIDGTTWSDALSLALICAVAMIPEGLDSIVTMTYAWSVSNMAKQNAIVRRLPAVETLGSVTVICSDKTGTLTKNEMSMVAYVTSNAHYRVDTNSKDRTPKTFVRDDDYLSNRAESAIGKSAKNVIRQGPSAHRDGKLGFGFSMHGLSGHSTGSGIGDIGDLDDLEDPDRPYDPTPVDDGESPSQSYIRNTLSCGVLCSKCALGVDGGKDGEIGNPTEISILRACYFAGIDIDTMKKDTPIIAEVPFSSEYKFMATIHESKNENDVDVYDDKYIIQVKGAPDRMLKYCSHQAKAGLLGETNIEPIDKVYWVEQIAILSSHGLRCLALCRGTVDKNQIQPGSNIKPGFVNERAEPWLTLIGICAIMDPPRPECVSAIAEAHGASVRVAMITGDHKDTALAIGAQLGLVDEKHPDGITGPELDAMTEEELRVAVQKFNIFARASPQNKIQIVRALQAEGEVCSMTGDGVNDAPALKAANMGVAMGKEGSDVAREASQMVLADDNFATIVVAIREGRVVWDNLRKVLMINQPINNAQGLSILFGIICGLPDSPLTGIQVLYCNLISAVTLGFIAAVEPAEDGIMKRPPRRLGKRLIGRYLFLRIVLGTTMLVTTTVGSVFWILKDYPDPYEQRGLALNVLSFGAMALALSARFEYSSAIHPRLFKGNVICWWMVVLMFVLQIFITYTPGLNTTIFEMVGMDGFMWGIVALFTTVTFIVMEFEKALRRYLSSMGKDTSDIEIDPQFDEIIFAKEPSFDPVPDDINKGDVDTTTTIGKE